MKNLLPHQIEAVKEITNGFLMQSRGQLIMPCGTGKTLVSVGVAREMNCSRIIVLAPSILLLYQLFQEWRENFNNFESLCVCSGNPLKGEMSKVTQEILSSFPKSSTETAVVSEFLKSASSLPKIVFCTYQSYGIIKSACENLSCSDHFDLAIADEAHHCAGLKDRLFSAVLNGYVGISKRLFMTATPRFINMNGCDRDAQVFSMDDVHSFGPVLYKLSFANALEMRLLSNYQVAAISVDPSLFQEELNWMDSKNNNTSIENLRYVAQHVAIADAMREYQLKNVVSFHNRVAAAREFSEDFIRYTAKMQEQKKPAGEIWSQHISGEMDDRLRNSLLDEFGSDNGYSSKLLCNARCLSEGIDVPEIDGIVFVDPRKSVIDIIQCVGRALRKKSHGNLATILVPIFLKDSSVPCPVLPIQSKNPFRPLLNVLHALSSIDEVMAQELQYVAKTAYRNNGTSKMPSRVKIPVGVQINDLLAGAFKVKLIKENPLHWYYMFGVLESYVQQHGHSRVPAKHVENGQPLGPWVSQQRMNFKRGQLSADRKEILEALPGWVWTVRIPYFEHGLQQYAKYRAMYGEKMFKRTYRDADGFGLGEWLTEMKKRLKNGKLSKSQKEALDKYPGWNRSLPEHVWDEKWNSYYSHLVAYFEKEGHLNVPTDYVIDDLYVGRWVALQRKLCRSGTIDQARLDLLLKLPGWNWNLRTPKWESFIVLLKKFVKREGHCSVPYGHRENGMRLGGFCKSQKRKYKMNKLPELKKRELENILGWSW